MCLPAGSLIKIFHHTMKVTDLIIFKFPNRSTGFGVVSAIALTAANVIAPYLVPLVSILQ